MPEQYTSEELKKWWVAVCPKCGWTGLSRDCEGGGQIADTGDYSDIICPECYKKDQWVVVEDAPRHIMN
jgi:RecJ-like exonuclease